MAAPDPVGYIFGGTSGVPTYEELKRRRAIAVALASRQKGFPKTLGEGMTYLGESIGDMLADRRLTAMERQAGLAGAANLAALRGTSGYEPGTGAAPAAPPGRPAPAAKPALPPEPVRPPPAPAPPRPQVSMVPVRPTPSDPYGATEGTGEGFAPGGILNPTPMTSELTPPPGMRGDLYPSEGTPSSSFISSAAAAPPSTLPAPAAAPPVSAMDFASWPQGPIRRPTDTAVEPGVATPPVAPPAAPATPRPPEAVSPAASLGPQSSLPQGPDRLSDFMRRTEGFAPEAQWDFKQYSIGYGTKGRPGQKMTREEAEGPLQQDLAKARGYVEAFAPQAPPGIKDALTSLTFNAGPGWQQAGLGRLIKEGRYDEARDRFLQYNKAGGQEHRGLVNRRNAEIAQFWNADGTAPARDQPDAIAQEMRPLPQRGGEETTLASYAPTGVMSDAPVPGMGGAGAMRIRPQIPPLPGPPPPPDEQVTPTNIEPMPATAQLQSGVLGQFGPPTGRFSEAPLPGVAAAPPSPPSQGPPAAAPPPTPQEPAPATYVGSTPSREPIPPASPQTMEAPGAPPVRNYPGGRPLSQRQQRAMQMMQDPRSDPASAGAAEQIFKIEEEYRKRAETQDESDYAAARTQHFHKVQEFEKFVREEADRNLKQQAARTDLEKTRADLEEKYYQQGIPRDQARRKADLEIAEKTRDLATPKTQMIEGVLYEYKPPTAASPGGWTRAPGTPEKEGKVTETESKTLLALRRSTVAEDMLKNTGALTKMEDVYKGKVPMGVGNYLVSDEYQKTKSAADAWILHTVRHESGAAIGIHEIPSIYPIYFAMPGDSEQQMAIKDARRRNATRALYDSLGTGPAKQQADKFFEDRKVRRTTEPEGTVQYNPATKKTRRVIGGHWDYGDAD